MKKVHIQKHRRVFICSPFRPQGTTARQKAEELRHNRQLARLACGYAVSRGFMPLAPHLFFPDFLSEYVPQEREAGIQFGMEWLLGCDEFWVIGSRITEGMKREIMMAKELDIPMRRQKEIENGVRYHDGRTHFFFGKVLCGECGAPMTRRTLRGYRGDKYKAWTCRERHKGRKGNGCMCRTIRETDLVAAICVQMGWEQFDEGRFEAEIEKVVVTEDSVNVVKTMAEFTA